MHQRGEIPTKALPRKEADIPSVSKYPGYHAARYALIQHCIDDLDEWTSHADRGEFLPRSGVALLRQGPRNRSCPVDFKSPGLVPIIPPPSGGSNGPGGGGSKVIVRPVHRPRRVFSTASRHLYETDFRVARSPLINLRLSSYLKSEFLTLERSSKGREITTSRNLSSRSRIA